MALRFPAAVLVSVVLWSVPAVAQQAKIQGKVVIEAVIGPTGEVISARVLRPTPILDTAAIGLEKQLAQPARNIVTAPADPKVIVVPQGYAVVDVTIGTNGAVREVTLVKGDATLAAATLDAIRTWRYAPTLLNGAPIEVKMTVLVPIK